MYEQLRRKELRHAYSVQGWSLLIYYAVMNVAVVAVMVVDTVVQMFSMTVSQQTTDLEQMTESIVENSAWGYFVAIAVGVLFLIIWKKPKFCFHTIWKRGRPVKPGSFFALFAMLVSTQLLVQVMAIGLEILLNQFGMSLMELLESASGSSDSLGMFLYVGFGAPIAEEVLFRGLILRSMEPYGKKFAIFASALLFGLYHCNIIQIPFAFGVGLILGYVTVEYNMIWAIVLHMFNNLIFGDTFVRLTGYLPEPWGDLAFWAFIILCSIAALAVLLVNHRKIKEYWTVYRDDPQCAKAFWSAPGIITLVAVLSVATVFTMVTLLMA